MALGSKKKKASFGDIINREKPVLIDFYADWCGPCKAMNPILKDVAKQVGKKATIIKIDVDKYAKLAAELGVRGVPTFMIYQKGQQKWSKAGMQSANSLVSLLSRAADGKL